MNPESEDSWRVRDGQKGDRRKWSDKNRQRRDRGGGTLGKETARDGWRQSGKRAGDSQTETEKREPEAGELKFPEAVLPLQQHALRASVA